jgi:hypothetical protein
MVNFLEPDRDDTHLHRPLDIDALLDRAFGKALLSYRFLYGRSHLVIYSAPGGSGVSIVARWRARARRKRVAPGRTRGQAARP